MIGLARISATCFSGNGWIPSIPGDLSVLRHFNDLRTCSSVTVNDSSGVVLRGFSGMSGSVEVSSFVKTEKYCSLKVSAISLAVFVSVPSFFFRLGNPEFFFLLLMYFHTPFEFPLHSLASFASNSFRAFFVACVDSFLLEIYHR